MQALLHGTFNCMASHRLDLQVMQSMIKEWTGTRFTRFENYNSSSTCANSDPGRVCTLQDPRRKRYSKSTQSTRLAH